MCHERLREAINEADKAISRTAELKPRLERRTGRVDAPTRAQAEEMCRRLQYVRRFPSDAALAVAPPSPWPLIVVTAAFLSTVLLIVALF